MEPYQRLANAVVETAANDYRTVLQKYADFPCDRENLAQKRELERFFKSEWFGVLTTADGEKLMLRLQQDVYRKSKRRYLRRLQPQVGRRAYHGEPQR
mgnify:CR=1 FL=1